MRNIPFVGVAGLVLALYLPIVRAQETPTTPAAAASRAFESMRKQVLGAVDAMPPEAYDTRAVAGGRSFAEAVGHGIDTNFGVCAGAQGLTSPKKDHRYEFEPLTKTELASLLSDSFAYCKPLVAGSTSNFVDFSFLFTHNAQMLMIMELQLASRGLAPKLSEAVPSARKPK